MMKLWVNSSKEEISVSVEYNADNEKECHEAWVKIRQSILLWDFNKDRSLKVLTEEMLNEW